MARFRRKTDRQRCPEKVEAFRYGKHMSCPGVFEDAAGNPLVHTADGINARVHKGDWIATDERGLRHVYSAEVFAVIYDPELPKDRKP